MESHKFHVPNHQAVIQLFISWATALPRSFRSLPPPKLWKTWNPRLLDVGAIPRVMTTLHLGSNVVEIPELMKVAGKIIYQR